MATTIRVMFRINHGAPARQMMAGDEQKGKEWMEAWSKIHQQWKKDPGIRFISHYAAPGRGLDDYSMHYLFEVDDVLKVDEMNRAIRMGQSPPFEKYSFEVVFGNTETDEFWKS